ncbi:MAG TPA: protein phosphatase 2C domain-containing protein [Microbacteriaceae bacterium]|nr:protein phosphatase 2C domain-containing protein [Microbacteriaceae bacterium]
MTIKGGDTGSFDWPVAGTPLRVHWATRTDVGRRREINEDAAVATPPVFAVADGMGGHEAGEVASACVVERLSELQGRTVSEDDVVSALRGAVADLAETGVDPGSGTTVSGIFLHDAEPAVTVFNIGDSRVYRFREGDLEQLTRDHSVVQDLVDAGELASEDAESHPHANVITRAVGFYDDPLPDSVRHAVASGDWYLVCSDGLTKELTSYGLSHFLEHAVDPAHAAESLLDAALQNGGRDNVTLVVLRITD